MRNLVPILIVAILALVLLSTSSNTGLVFEDDIMVGWNAAHKIGADCVDAKEMTYCCSEQCGKVCQTQDRCFGTCKKHCGKIAYSIKSTY